MTENLKDVKDLLEASPVDYIKQGKKNSSKMSSTDKFFSFIHALTAIVFGDSGTTEGEMNALYSKNKFVKYFTRGVIIFGFMLVVVMVVMFVITVLVPYLGSL